MCSHQEIRDEVDAVYRRIQIADAQRDAIERWRNAQVIRFGVLMKELREAEGDRTPRTP